MAETRVYGNWHFVIQETDQGMCMGFQKTQAQIASQLACLESQNHLGWKEPQGPQGILHFQLEDSLPLTCGKCCV